LGSLFRDKDFRGQTFSLPSSALIVSDTVGNGRPAGLAVDSALDQTEVALDTATSGVGAPGDVLVHCDGEQTNLTLVVNFRTTRGGSVFVGSGPHPGGSASVQLLDGQAATDHVNVLNGRAMLVRNQVTNVGLNEVSAGDELMLLVLTNVTRGTATGVQQGFIDIGTNGTGEGYSAADLYRISGHPLVQNNVRMSLDPATIQLTNRTT
jgi:hypothetical protein